MLPRQPYRLGVALDHRNGRAISAGRRPTTVVNPRVPPRAPLRPIDGGWSVVGGRLGCWASAGP
jgi:hypothetical protein